MEMTIISRISAIFCFRFVCPLQLGLVTPFGRRLVSKHRSFQDVQPKISLHWPPRPCYRDIWPEILRIHLSTLHSHLPCCSETMKPSNSVNRVWRQIHNMQEKLDFDKVCPHQEVVKHEPHQSKVMMILYDDDTRKELLPCMYTMHLTWLICHYIVNSPSVFLQTYNRCLTQHST
jgi:hypothetical protein